MPESALELALLLSEVEGLEDRAHVLGKTEEADKWTKEKDEIKTKLEALDAQVAKMREALAFYADESNWEEWQGGRRRCGGDSYRYEWVGCWEECPRSEDPSAGPTRAKVALAEPQKEG